MSPITDFNALAVAWWGLIVAVVWQSTLLAGIVAVVAWLLRRSSPTVRYWLWQIVAIKILLAPAWTLAVPVAWLPPHAAGPSPAHVSAEDKSVAIESQKLVASRTVAPAAAVGPTDLPPVVAPAPAKSSAAQRPALSWQSWLMLAWAAVIGVQLVVLAGQRARLARLLRNSAPAESALVTLVADTAARLKLRRVPRVLVTEVECSPFVCGLVRPTIVLPGSLEALFSREQIAPVVVHELAHIKRLDLLFGWIPQIARMVYFFHPIAHLAAFRVRLEAELACDGWAMAETGHGAGAYADLLVRIVSRLSEPAMLHTGSASSAGLDGQTAIEKKE